MVVLTLSNMHSMTKIRIIYFTSANYPYKNRLANSLTKSLNDNDVSTKAKNSLL